jgi:PAS domain S-box-containing protein
MGLPDGHVPIIREVTVPIFDGDRIVAIIGVGNKATDYTEWDIDALTLLVQNAWSAIQRKRAEQSLMQREALYRQMFTDNSAVMLLIDPESGDIDEANPAAEKFYGYSVSELQTMKLQQISLLQPDELACVMVDVLTRKKSFLEGSHVTAHGDIRNVEVHCVPIYLKGRTLLYSIIHDISPRKKAEAEILKYQNQLEDMVAERTTELRETEKKLQQSQKLEAIGQLAGGIAHDFNNILTVILGYAEQMMGAVPMEDPLYADICEIQDAGNRAATLTRQLLAFSRKQALQPIILDLDERVSDKKILLSRLIGENIELTLLLAGDLGLVKADPSQIDQVIMNLAINARDAMPEGGRLTFETKNTVISENNTHQDVTIPKGIYSLLSVTDTGAGMAPDVLSRIFEPFFTTKEKGKGTGLGLSTVYGIVKQSGGYIWVYSEPGQGTTFKIYLPHVNDVKTEVESATNKVRQGQGEKVILVEDEDDVRKLLCRMVTKLGYLCHAVKDPQDAVHFVRENIIVPDLLITDVVMPGMSGKVLSEKIKALKSDLRVLYMSGYTDNTIIHHGILDEGVFFIQKPFGIKDLSMKIREILSADGL